MNDITTDASFAGFTAPPSVNYRTTRMGEWSLQSFDFSAPAKRGWAPIMRQWHQRFGLYAAIFMFWLGCSGFLLNQSASWGLDAVRVGNSTVMGLYGLRGHAPETGYFSGQNWLAQSTEHTVVNGHSLPELVPSPLGLVATGDPNNPLLFVAGSDRIVITDPNARVIDELRDYTLPVSAIRRIGHLSDGRVAIQDAKIFATEDGLGWTEIPEDSVIDWSSPKELDPSLQEIMLPFSQPTVPLEQVLIDAHSGRLFGRAGPWIVNSVGFAAMFLGISGTWIYISTALRRRQRARS